MCWQELGVSGQDTVDGLGRGESRQNKEVGNLYSNSGLGFSSLWIISLGQQNSKSSMLIL